MVYNEKLFAASYLLSSPADDRYASYCLYNLPLSVKMLDFTFQLFIYRYKIFDRGV